MRGRWAGRPPSGPRPSNITHRIDSVVLHKLWGPLVFAATIAVVFEAIFTAAVPLMDGTEALVAASGEFVAQTLPDHWLRDASGRRRVGGCRVGGGVPAP